MQNGNRVDIFGAKRLLPLACIVWGAVSAEGSPAPSSPDKSDSTIASQALVGRPQETWATCQVLIWIRSSGRVQAAQVVKSSGMSLLDRACLNGAIGQIFPANTNTTVAGDRWEVLPFRWLATSAHKYSSPREVAVPNLARDQTLNVDPPYYPISARQQRKEGVCAMHIVVAADGEIRNIKITLSTDIPELDSACLDAMHAARFVPAQRDGQNVAAGTDVWLAWRLPE